MSGYFLSLDTWKHMMSTGIDMLRYGADNYQLLLLAYPGIDQVGHAHGPDSEQLGTAMEEADVLLQHMWKELQKNV